MTVSLVAGQTAASQSGNNTSQAQSFPGNMTQGNLVVIVIGTTVAGFSVSTCTFSSAAGTPSLTRLRAQGAAEILEIWYGIVPATPGAAITVTNAANTIKHMMQMEFSGNSTTAGATDSATTGVADGYEATVDHASASVSDSGTGISTTVADAVLIGTLQCGGNHGSSPPSCTLGGSAATSTINTLRAAMGYRVVAATGTYDSQFSWLTPQAWSNQTAAFEGAAAAGLAGRIMESRILRGGMIRGGMIHR